MENRLRLFAFHLWSLVLCSRTAFVWTMMSFHYDNRILKPTFCLVLQVWAFLFLTSMRSTNLNMKGKKGIMSSCNILRNGKRFYWIRFAWQKPHVLFPLLYSRLGSLISIFSKNIIYNFNFELFLFCFFPLNWSKANKINVIKPEKSGKEVIGVQITHKSGLHCWNHFLKQFRNAFTDTWPWRKSFSARSMSLKWKLTEGLSGEPGQNWHLTKVTAWPLQSHTATSLKCWLPGHEKETNS